MVPQTVLEAPRDRFDPQQTRFIQRIEEYGWTGTFVDAGSKGPGFSYTTGFYNSLGVPDLIAFSIPYEPMNEIFWDLYRRQKEGERFALGVPLTDVLGDDVPVVFLPINRARHKDYVTWTTWFHLGRPFDCVQMVWSDKSGRFPWQAGSSGDLRVFQEDMTPGYWSGRRRGV